MTRWGILATGHIAARFAEDLRLVPGAELVAVGSRTTASAERFAEQHGATRAYGTWDDLVADPEVDVIYVATPHAAHHEAARTCLVAGKPALVEKPFTLDLATSTELVEIARAGNVFLMEAMWMRCNPLILRACELIAEGAIGTVTGVRADFGVAGPFPPEHRMRARALGGGALLDLGVYPVSLAHLILGVPQHLRSWAKLGPEGTDENTGIVLGYDSGAVATLSCGMVGATGLTASIVGTTGRIELPDPFFRPDGFTLHRADEPAETITAELVGNGYQYEAIEVQRCLTEGLTESPLVPHSATLEIMTLLDDVRAQIGVSYL
ncbi:MULTISPECIES: Gfo/Idh/MocA family protein [unclassified Micromonospora]|uniref:Gfo/Idh/MocA family protein n=1 Tax=unclassified Micromonospora TaxID=2617518 RepID=UPI00103542DA|nr:MULTISPECIES: Gfo/Idh/MocA family oxidoreductase [unclassified Micromonospora]QKW16514.1 Gfo/Idh/MocA family oxidoreductase [Verrucosispora sp. NA02020]TBL38301.1 Gfo/Idh/MocA family oxidoreductase [Verrucosispora sp. SN26_14.1]